MVTVRTYRVAHDDVMALFSGSDAVAARLTALAIRAFGPPPKAPSVGTLDRLGPFSRHPVGGAPVVRPGVPTRRELDAVLAGEPVPDDRLTAAWALVELWLADVATAVETTEHDDAGAEGVRVWERSPLQLPLAPPPGVVVGYADGVLGIVSRSPR